MQSQNVFEMHVIIFNDLNISEEVAYFIDINTTQKGFRLHYY